MKATLLASAISLLSMGACSDKTSDPAPAAPASTEHTVQLRYSVVSFGDASQLPTTPPRIRVLYERVSLQNGAYVRGMATTELDVTNASTTGRDVTLPVIITFKGQPTPRIIVITSVSQVPATGFQQGYRVPVELLVDGKSAAGATYSAAFGAAQGTPLSVKTEVEVVH